MKTFHTKIKKYFSPFIVLIFALSSILPLFHAGLIPTHDGEYHLIRFYEFDKMLRSGSWYPRWAPDLNYGFGVPLFTFVYPLPNYYSSLLHFFGISFLDNVKFNMATATIVGAITMFAWVKRLWGEKSALVASIFYTFAPYHFVDIYVRGSVGEVWALGLFPGFLWAFTAFMQTKRMIYFVVAAIFLALTIFSHNIVGLMSFAFAISYMFLLISQEKRKKIALIFSNAILFGGLLLSTIFWIPALIEKQFVSGLQVYTVTQNFADIFQLIFPSWGTGFYGAGLDNQMSVQIGTANLFVIFLSILTIWQLIKNRKKKTLTLVLFFLGWFALLFYLMIPESIFLWQHVPLMNYFQFPWRFLSLTILVCAALAGWIVSFWKSKVFAIILMLIAFGTTYSYTQPAYYMLRNDTYYTSRPNFIDGTNSVGNVFNTKWGKLQLHHATSVFVKNNNVVINNITKNSPINYSANSSSIQPTQQIMNISYFPGWIAYVDNKKVTTSEAHGLLTFQLNAGKHNIHVIYEETPVEQAASWITIVTFSLLILLFLLRKKIDRASMRIWEN